MRHRPFRAGSRALLLTLGAAAAIDCRTPEAADPTATVNAALATYARYAAAMAHDSVASLFTEHGELGGAGQPTIVGPAAIRAHLESFKGFHVLANDLQADTTLVARDTAYQTGTFRQRVIVPAGDTVVAQGRFAIVWVRERGGAWHVKSMRTRPPS